MPRGERRTNSTRVATPVEILSTPPPVAIRTCEASDGTLALTFGRLIKRAERGHRLGTWMGLSHNVSNFYLRVSLFLARLLRSALVRFFPPFAFFSTRSRHAVCRAPARTSSFAWA